MPRMLRRRNCIKLEVYREAIEAVHETLDQMFEEEETPEANKEIDRLLDILEKLDIECDIIYSRRERRPQRYIGCPFNRGNHHWYVERFRQQWQALEEQT